MEGPRVLRSDELLSLSTLVDTVLAQSKTGIMFEWFPEYFAEHNLENHFVYVDNGCVVSHFGMELHSANLAGCQVRAALVGAVATYEEYRGRGYATSLFDLCRERAVAAGADFMLISGGRGLYRRAGAADVGCDYLARPDAGRAYPAAGSGIEVALATEEELPLCAEAYTRRPACFLRPIEVWRLAFDNRIALTRTVDVLVVRRDGDFRGYFVVAESETDGEHHIIEFAGSEPDLVAALPAVMAQRRCGILEIRLQQCDRILRTLLERAGVELRPTHTGGTFLILRFAALMERLMPFIESRIGRHAAAALSFEEDGDRCVFVDANERISLDRAQAAQFIFGHPDAPPRPGIWNRVFPAPTLWYGINYV